MMKEERLERILNKEDRTKEILTNRRAKGKAKRKNQLVESLLTGVVLGAFIAVPFTNYIAYLLGYFN